MDVWREPASSWFVDGESSEGQSRPSSSASSFFSTFKSLPSASPLSTPRIALERPSTAGSDQPSTASLPRLISNLVSLDDEEKSEAVIQLALLIDCSAQEEMEAIGERIRSLGGVAAPNGRFLCFAHCAVCTVDMSTSPDPAYPVPLRTTLMVLPTAMIWTGGIERLVQLLEHPDASIHQSALLILGNLSTDTVDPDAEATKVFAPDPTHSTIRLSVSHPSLHVLTAWSCGCVCADPSKGAWRLCQALAPPLLA